MTLTNINGNGTVGITVAAGKASDGMDGDSDNISGNGTVGITVAAGTDIAGNTDPGASSAVSVIADNTPPTINITGPVPAQANSSGSVDYTVTYADVNFSTATLAAADITLNPTGGVTASKAVSGGPTVWTVTLTNITGNGTVGITVAAGKASDLAGNTDPGAPRPYR